MKISGIAGILTVVTAVTGAAIPKRSLLGLDVGADANVANAVNADVDAGVNVLKRDIADIDAKIRANVLNILGRGESAWGWQHRSQR